MLTKNTPITKHRQDDPPPPQNAEQRETILPTRLWHRIALAGIVVLAAFLNFYQQSQNGYGNEFYAAAVRSMLDSWHNFFFVSFDPGGFVTVDKPPLGLWIQTASAALFGFSGFSIILPQAIAGILAVLVLYWLVRRKFGPVAGLLAALFLAITPISVAMSRDNNLDTLLVLFVLLAAWAISLAAETGRFRWLLLGALLIALGFNIKTLEAYLVVPALGLLYLLSAPLSWRKRILHLAMATLVMLVVSFSWIIAVDMTPASQRPFVDSTQDNSELSLTLGYNGIQRLLGMSGGPGGGGTAQNAERPTSTTGSSASASSQTPSPEATNFPGGFNGGEGANAGGPGGMGNMFNGGESPSALRLFHVDLGGQVSWLLPMALLGLLALLWQRRVSLPLDKHWQTAVLWGLWLLTMGIFFSVANFFHTYYMVIIAPSIAALAAIGLVTLWQDYRTRADWRSWILPLALLLTAAEQVYLLSFYDTWNTILSPTILVLTIIPALVLIFAHLRPAAMSNMVPWLRAMVLVSATALVMTPATWSFITTLSAENTTLPTAGPSTRNTTMAFGGGEGARGDQQGTPPAGFGMGGNRTADQQLINYLLANQGTTHYLVATTSSMSADSIIITTNKPVMSLGGFSGSDPILTQSQLISLIKNGTVRYFLTQSGGPGGGPSNQNGITSDSSTQTSEGVESTRRTGGGVLGGGQNQQLTSWVEANCSTVSSSLWSSSSTQSSAIGGGFGGGQQLYDCATQK